MYSVTLAWCYKQRLWLDVGLFWAKSPGKIWQSMLTTLFGDPSKRGKTGSLEKFSLLADGARRKPQTSTYKENQKWPKGWINSVEFHLRSRVVIQLFIPPWFGDEVFDKQGCYYWIFEGRAIVIIFIGSARFGTAKFEFHLCSGQSLKKLTPPVLIPRTGLKVF